MKTAAKENLLQLKDFLQGLSKEDYFRKSEILSGSALGQHIRHILEFYLLLISGSLSGTISYDKRKRDIRIESDPEFALETIDRLIKGVDILNESDPVKLEADYTVDGTAGNTIPSSIGRELAYCIEHSIHHQAIIKAGLIAMGLNNLTDEQFGVAYSTIRYRKKSYAGER